VTDSSHERGTPEGQEPVAGGGAQRPGGEPAPAPAGPFGEPLGEPGDDTVEEAGVATGNGAAANDGAPDPAQAEVPSPEGDELTLTRMELAERTADLQRLQAEFLNYKRRVDRDRELIRENATYTALAPITEVLDTIDRAREHAPLEGGFKAVADQLERVVAAVGMTKFGAVGDAFDPTIHEALSHIGEDPDVAVTTCKVIAKAGYRIGERVVRAAQVLVVDPPSGPGPGDEGRAGGEGADEGADDERTPDDE
jgi:molecular chaperone GrpE